MADVVKSFFSKEWEMQACMDVVQDLWDWELWNMMRDFHSQNNSDLQNVVS